MLAQRLRHRATVQHLTTTRGDGGSKREGFTTWLEHEPCEILALSGRELIASSNEWGKVTHRITMRSRPGFLASDRVVDEADDSAVVYNVRAVLPDFKLNQYVTLMCESGVNNG